MDLFLQILTQVTLPIVLIIGLGVVAQPILKFHLPTLTSMQLNVILPCFLIHFFATSQLPLSALAPTVGFTAVQFVTFTAIGWALGRLAGLDDPTARLAGLALAFPNTGNYGIPVAQLAFADEWVLHQISIMASQSAFIVIGVVALFATLQATEKEAGAQETGRNPWHALFLNPMIWAVIIGATFRALEVPLPALVAGPMKLLGDTFVPFALFALGVGLVKPLKALDMRALSFITSTKILLGPALTWLLAIVMGFEGELLRLLVVASAAPVGVLLAIFAMNYGVRERLSSAAVLITTVISPLAVTGWITIMRLYG